MTERPRTVAMILNPASGGGAGRKQRGALERALAERGVACTVHETAGPGDGVTIAQRLAADGADVIIAAGGDGTIHDVANGILRAATDRCALGLIPIGTGNDFVKVVPGTRPLPAAFETIKSGVPRRFDVGRVRWAEQQEYFINGMGTGIDVEVVRQLVRLPHMPGPVKYLVALLRALFSFQPIPLAVHIDDQHVQQRVMITAVGNGICQGGGFYLAPKASPSDGLLDVAIVAELNLLGIARVLPRIMRGTQEGDRAVLMRTARSIRFEATDGRPLFFHLDGELREPAGLRSLQIDVLPAALPVLTSTGT